MSTKRKEFERVFVTKLAHASNYFCGGDHIFKMFMQKDEGYMMTKMLLADHGNFWKPIHPLKAIKTDDASPG